MEFHRIDELPRYRDMGAGAFWSSPASISPAQTQAAMARARLLRSQATYRAFAILARGVRRLARAAARRAVPRLPTGAHGPDAIDFKCAHGRPC